MVDDLKQDTYRELFERSADAILIIVGDKFVDCNDSTVRMLRFNNKQDLLNTHPSQLSPERQPDGRLSYEKANEMIAIAFDKGSHRFEWNHKRSDGEIFPVEVLLTAITEGQQNTLHVVWREISDRKKAESALLRLSSIIESTSDMVATATPDGKIQYVNNAGLEMLGWELQNVSGKKIQDVHPEWALRNIYQGKSAAIANGIWMGETAIRGKDGREIPVSQAIMSHKTDQGDLEYLSTIIRDISDRKEAEKNLKNNLHLLHSIINNQPTCVKLVRSDGTIIDMNPAGLNMIAATSKAEVIGKNIYDLIEEADREPFRQFNEKVCQGEKSTFHFTMKALDGNARHMESVAVPLQYGPSGETVLLGITRDVTQEIADHAEKRKLQNQLHQAQKLESIGTLAGGIAHDFNNILSVIMGFAELAMLDIYNPDSLREYLDAIFKATDRAKKLVKQILTFSRKSPQQLRPLNVQLIVKEALNLLRSSIPTTIEIRQSIAPDCRKVLADPTQIHQIIMNLCTNAYHAMREKGGVLSVSLQPAILSSEDIDGKFSNEPGPYVNLEVCDSGIGMPNEILEKIFEPYFSTKEAGEGTGLGLAVVHGIVSSMNGLIRVKSEPGKGTSFNIYLPVIEAKEEFFPEEPAATIPTGNEHILLIDDDADIAKMDKSMLEKFGYKITALSCGSEAIKIFQSNPESFDLVVTDMTMPKITGSELAREILAVRPDIPIILCTGYNELINEQKAKSIGICEYIMKPVKMKDFLKTVRKALDGSGCTKQKKSSQPDLYLNRS